MVECFGPFGVFPGILGWVETGTVQYLLMLGLSGLQNSPFFSWGHGKRILTEGIVVVGSGSNGSCCGHTSCCC